MFAGEKGYLFGSINNTLPPPAGQADSAEVAEALVQGNKSICISCPPINSGVPQTDRTITWETIYPSAPATVTMLLEGAMRDFDGAPSEYVTVDTSTNVSGEVRQTQITGFEYFRARASVVTGGSSPTCIVKMKGV